MTSCTHSCISSGLTTLPLENCSKVEELLMSYSHSPRNTSITSRNFTSHVNRRKANLPEQTDRAIDAFVEEYHTDHLAPQKSMQRLRLVVAFAGKLIT